MQVPHFGVTPLRFAEMIARGHRPRIPATAPPEWSALITVRVRGRECVCVVSLSALTIAQQCWSSEPTNRPTFVELLQRHENVFTSTTIASDV